ncbi:MAG: ABC transporter permease [Myxococcota bacterium]|jgi:putative ABC transport system permease protein|nr:ABC transporter permease [Myxococcota bacterium]
MSPIDTLLMAFRAIARNTARSILTALGIVIGVASVITMVHFGNATTASVTSQISAMGTNLLIVQPGMGFRRSPGAAPRAFDAEDLQALEQGVRGIALFAPVSSTQVRAIFGNYSESISVVGTSSAFFEIRNWPLARGRDFEAREQQAGSAVCIIGATVVENFYAGQEPLGTTLRLGRSACTVVGVLSEKGESMGQDQDALVVMPVKAVQRRLKGSSAFDSFYLSAVAGNSTAHVKAVVSSILRSTRRIQPGKDDDFHVRDMEEMVSTLTGVTQSLTLLLGAIAAISLLVGGIGIMNIMLVSVTERTREIGIRLAIGAKSSDVRLQFLVEGVVLSCLGGSLGIVLGLAASYFALQAIGMDFALSLPIVVVGFFFSVGIGVVFGYFPARKASLLNPIESLRHE